MKVVIAGLGKSGTTALFFTVKQSMPLDTHHLFEPSRFDGRSGTASNVLAKILIRDGGATDYASFDDFEKKVLIIRDPRDIIISRVLYDIYNAPDACRDDAKVDAFVRLLRRKEAEPHNVSLLEIIDLLDRICGRGVLRRTATAGDLALEFQRGHADYFMFRYEDFVCADLAPLERYVGLPLAAGPRVVPADLSRVVRTKTSGNWRNWLTPADVEFFGPRLAQFIRNNGYSEDWTLALSPSISPEHGSDYVLRIVAEHRAL